MNAAQRMNVAFELIIAKSSLLRDQPLPDAGPLEVDHAVLDFLKRE